MANITAKISSFSVTCNRLSQYMKENGSGSLSFSSLGKSEMYRPPTTMNLLPGVDVSADKERVSVPMELFPQRAGLGLDEPEANIREPEKAPLTIFYAGKVLVFDNFPADKAQDLMKLASNNNSSANNLDLAPPVATVASTPVNPVSIAKPTQVVVSNLPIARKASLHRFLEKRKDRINAKAPYQAKPKDFSVDTSRAEERQPWLGLKNQA